MHLTEIPKYVEIHKNDTIETFGTNSYPEGIPIGEIIDYQLDNSTGKWDIKVQLFQNMEKISHVYVINNLERAKIDSLEQKTELLDAE